jgi:hypothetical protein
MRTPGADALFVDQSNTDAYFGQVAKAGEWLQRAVAAAGRNDVKGQAGVWSGVDALREAMFGQIEDARRQARAALDLEDSWETHALAAMALARVGDAAQARELADKLNAERPLGTLVQNWPPFAPKSRSKRATRQRPSSCFEPLNPTSWPTRACRCCPRTCVATHTSTCATDAPRTNFKSYCSAAAWWALAHWECWLMLVWRVRTRSRATR